jgi:hypothetical protein
MAADHMVANYMAADHMMANNMVDNHISKCPAIVSYN